MADHCVPFLQTQAEGHRDTGAAFGSCICWSLLGQCQANRSDIGRGTRLRQEHLLPTADGQSKISLVPRQSGKPVTLPKVLGYA